MTAASAEGEGNPSLKDRLLSITQSQRSNAIVIGILAISLAGIIVAWMWGASANYKPLYADQDQYPTGDVIAVLEAENIPYELDLATGRVYVRDGTVASTRMLLASRSVLPTRPQGFELLDDISPLGTSQFMESSRYKRGLEGELALTIMGLESVRNARVHLAIPERTLFIRETGFNPSASVLLELVNNQPLSKDAVEAVVNLVAASVSGMQQQDVAVSDQFGNLLSAEIGNELDGSFDERLVQYQRNFERELVERASRMLLPLFGAGNFQVQATADLNFDVRRETAAVLEGDPTVVQETLINSSSPERAAIGIPGTLSNQPPPPTEITADNPVTEEVVEQRLENSEERRTFAQGQREITTQYRQGEIERLSVAVVLNNAVANGATGEFSQEELDRISETLSAALGVDDVRGDSLVISAFNFAPPVEFAARTVEWYEQPAMQQWGRYGLGLVTVLLLTLVVVRPLVRSITTGATPYPVPAKLAHSGEDDNTAEFDEEELQNYAIKEDEIIQPGQLPRPGSPIHIQLSHLRSLADEDAEKVAEVLKGWPNE
ncbi:flagellar basal-body MS-ring/collar protein FliF [uncultured Umboniibacter sp.]|uniref:flagellar basal-body MS-ring/collar protein FliF n=1 Tax=uncultured Umboniibacter sp. TaxID=1798917 RepID=UPI00260D5574|nr:flagellar basal-body MS-ring/collar protein FliF [uncultured Umboniibacter sp.]